MPAFNKIYFGVAILLFFVELLIALFVHDQFIRPYLGDVLVVILLYCFLKSFFKVAVLSAAIAVLIFSFTIEFLQLINIVNVMGLEKLKIARTVIGTSFSVVDLATYVIGIVIVLVVEMYLFKKERGSLFNCIP